MKRLLLIWFRYWEGSQRTITPYRVWKGLFFTSWGFVGKQHNVASRWGDWLRLLWWLWVGLGEGWIGFPWFELPACPIEGEPKVLWAIEEGRIVGLQSCQWSDIKNTVTLLIINPLLCPVYFLYSPSQSSSLYNVSFIACYLCLHSTANSMGPLLFHFIH